MAVKPYSKKMLGFKAEKISDRIFGATDGTISTLAVISGVAGATSSSFIILVAGASAMLAEAISMGFSSYSAAKTREQILGKRKKHHRESPIAEGVGFWLATMGGGFVPLVPFLIPGVAENIFPSIILSALFLFIIGVNSARIAGTGNVIGTGVRSALIGLVAAAITYSVGLAFAELAGQPVPLA